MQSHSPDEQFDQTINLSEEIQRLDVPEVLPKKKIIQSIKEALTENPNRAVIKIASREKWIKTKIVRKESIKPECWQVLSVALSHPSIASQKSIKIVRNEIINKDVTALSQGALEAYRKIILLNKQSDKPTHFRSLYQLSKYINDSCQTDSLECEKLLLSISNKIDKSLEPEKVTEILFALSNLHYQKSPALPRYALKDFKACFIEAIHNEDCTSHFTTLEHLINRTSLAQKHKTLIISILENKENSLHLSGHSSFEESIQFIQHVLVTHTAIDELNENSSLVNSLLKTEAFEALGKREETQFLSEIYKKIGELRNSKLFNSENIQILSKDISEDIPYDSIKIMIEYSEYFHISYAEVSSKFKKIPTKVLAALDNILDEFQRDDFEKIVELSKNIKSLIRDKSFPHKNLPHFLNIYKKFGKPKMNELVATYLAQLTLIPSPGFKNEFSIPNFDTTLRLAEELVNKGLTFTEAAEAAGKYWTKVNLRQRDLIEFTSLLSKSKIDNLNNLIIKNAGDPNISNREFGRTLKILGIIQPDTWKTISKSYHSEQIGYIFEHPTQLDENDVRTILSQFEDINKTTFKDKYNSLEQKIIGKKIYSSLIDYVVSNDMSNENKKKRAIALNQIAGLYRTDTGPYPYYQKKSKAQQAHPDYTQMLKEIRAVYYGAYELHNGFGHLTFECRSLPNEDWLLTQFGQDVAIRVDRLHTNKLDQFPGPGVILSGLKIDNIFAQDKQNPEDPYHHIKENWGWIAKELTDIESTRYLFSRGVFGIIAPNKEKYILDGNHYSLLIWNEHFNNPDHSVAALVPTKVLQKLLKGKHSLADNMQNMHFDKMNSAHGNQLTLEELSKICEDENTPLLNLGWASNLGGLCNAYPPMSEPFFGWEKELKHHTKDKAGHVHKSHITGQYLVQMNKEMDRMLKPLRDAHKNVYNISTAYLNLYDLLRLSLAQWHKGLTTTDEIGENGELDLNNEDSEDSPMGAKETRMLEKAYKWNELHKKGITDKGAYPILCLPPTLDYWNKIKSPFYLDTFDLTIVTPGFEGKLPENTNGTGAFEATIWKKYVRNLYYRRSDLDLRFIHRESLEDYDKNAT